MRRLLALVWLFAAGVFGQSYTVPSAHPRIWWTPTRVAQAQSWVAANPFTPTNNPQSHQWVYDQLLMYVVTGTPSYCRTAIDWSISTATIPPTELATNQSDHARWYGEQVALTYDWCWNEMTQPERDLLRDRWYNYNDVLIHKTAWGNVTMPASNYFWGYWRNNMEWGIATYGEASVVVPTQYGVAGHTVTYQNLIDDALVTRWPAFTTWAATSTAACLTSTSTPTCSHGKGGIPSEGTEYGPYMAGYPQVALTNFADMGRDLRTETNWWREMIYSMIYLTTPGPTTRASDSSVYYQMVPWSDCCDVASDVFYPSVKHAWWDEGMRAMAQWASPSTTIAKHARQWLSLYATAGGDFFKFISASDPGGTAIPFTSLPYDYYAPGPKWMTTRTSWATDAALVFLQAGGQISGLGHGHEDYGSFQFLSEGAWLSKEATSYGEQVVGFAGAGQNTAGTAVGHNTLLYEGLAWPSGVYQETEPIVRRLESQPAYSYLVTDLNTLYRAVSRPAVDNPYYKSAVREFLFIRPLKTLVVFDRLESQWNPRTGDAHTPVLATDVRKTFLLHTPNAPVISGNQITAVNGAATMQAWAMLPTTAIRSVNEYSPALTGSKFSPLSVYGYRTEIEVSGAAQSYLLTVMQGRATSGGQDIVPSVVDNGTSYTLTLTHPTLGSAVVTFDKGMASTGGTFGYAATGTPSPSALATTVTEPSVTDSGVSWTGFALAVQTASLPSGTVGTAYSRTLSAVGGTTPYSWDISAGSLCSGLSMSTAGVISGTPATAQTCSFTVRVTDALAATATQALSITVASGGAAPVAPTITTASLADGTVGVAYTQTLAATGDTPITWSVVVGALPAWATLNASTGAITGTPNAAAATSFTARATNVAGVSNKAFSLTVNAAPPAGAGSVVKGSFKGKVGK